VGGVLEDFLTPYKLEYKAASKMEAIKHLRETTGIGLSDAKQVVDHYADKHPGSLI